MISPLCPKYLPRARISLWNVWLFFINRVFNSINFCWLGGSGDELFGDFPCGKNPKKPGETPKTHPRLLKREESRAWREKGWNIPGIAQRRAGFDLPAWFSWGFVLFFSCRSRIPTWFYCGDPWPFSPCNPDGIPGVKEDKHGKVIKRSCCSTSPVRWVQGWEGFQTNLSGPGFPGICTRKVIGKQIPESWSHRVPWVGKEQQHQQENSQEFLG